MSIEDKIERIADSLERIADSLEHAAESPAAPVAPPAPKPVAVTPAPKPAAPAPAPPAAPAAAPAPAAPAAAPAPAETPMTAQELNNVLVAEFKRLGSRDGIVAVMEELGAGGINELKPEQYADLIARVKAL